jgi:rhamnogalacturonan endolyase
MDSALRLTIFVWLLPMVLSYGQQPMDQLLFEDGFATLHPGTLMPEVGPHPEYHYVREAVPPGPWAVTTFDSAIESQAAWRAVRNDDGTAALQQTYHGKAKHWHPMVVAGESTWQDYRVTATLHLEELDRRVGIAVRQRNDRCYYFVGIDDGRAKIIRVQHESEFRIPNETELASADVSLQANTELKIEVTAVGDHLAATIGDATLDAYDSSFPAGRIALLADVPARFSRVMVHCSKAELTRLNVALEQCERETNDAASSQPLAKLWRKIPTPQFGTDRNIRFGDLDGDGQIDLLLGQINHHGPTDANSELGCLTAIRLDGTMLWQIGTPDRWRNHLTNDVAFQINDIDGDGQNEVIYCQAMELIIAAGATGKRLRSIPTPVNTSTRKPFDRFPRILGDSLLVADLRGSGHRGDIILKDRYENAWAFDDQLQPLWKVTCNTGHFPFPGDTDSDGRDEISLGYSRFSSTGELTWSHDQTFQDHADSVAVVDLDGDGQRETLWAASDEGFVLLDESGLPRQHLRIGHAQNLTVADLRPDQPGLEVAIANFWKNQGLIHILDSRGNVIADFEPRPEHGSTLAPAFWKGDGSELLFLNPDPVHGGLYDGSGRKLVTLPADGHPTKAYDALDLTGDQRDELVVWDSREIWIYTQDREADTLVAAPRRNSRSNESNYRARVSIPAGFPE